MRLVPVVLCSLALLACRPPGWGQDGDDEVAADAGPDAPVTPDAPAVDGPAATCEQTFRLEDPAASAVWVTGDFTGWAGTPEAGALEMTLGDDGAWTAGRTFEPGVYQYKFIVDGDAWIADPGNPEGIDDGFGGRNSLYTCG